MARKNDDTRLSFLKNTSKKKKKKKEMIVYCYECRDFIRSLFFYLRPLSE